MNGRLQTPAGMMTRILRVAPYLLVNDVKNSAEWQRDRLVMKFSAAACMLAPLITACSMQPLPTQPSMTAAVPATATAVALEGEAGSGDGQIRERSRASGGLTVHLGPGERRVWTFTVRAGVTSYAFAITYSNGQEGPNEMLHLAVDGTAVASFRNRDSGDSVEGWNLFVTDPAGRSALGTGSHTLTLDVTGGDGCVEIDVVTLSPAA
jgi:hypothetical protein